MAKKVLVSGCYDLLHSGHIAFFQEASSYGDLYVALGSDKTVFDLKGRAPLNNEDERLYMVKSVSYVTDAFVSQGSGMLDFLDEFHTLKPEIFIVNEDGNTPDKQALCEQYGVEYVVLEAPTSWGSDAAFNDRPAYGKSDSIPYRFGRRLARPAVCFASLSWAGHYYFDRTYADLQRPQRDGLQHAPGSN